MTPASAALDAGRALAENYGAANQDANESGQTGFHQNTRVGLAAVEFSGNETTPKN